MRAFLDWLYDTFVHPVDELFAAMVLAAAVDIVVQSVKRGRAARFQVDAAGECSAVSGG